MARFVAAFRLLSRRPLPGHAREDLLPGEIRFWPVDAYLILYPADRNHSRDPWSSRYAGDREPPFTMIC